jgi:hypothetical protein
MICPFCSLDMEPISLSGKTFCSNCGMTIYERPDLKVMPSIMKDPEPPKIKDVHLEIPDSDFDGILDESGEGTKPILENTPNATDISSQNTPEVKSEPMASMPDLEPDLLKPATPPVPAPPASQTTPATQTPAPLGQPPSTPVVIAGPKVAPALPEAPAQPVVAQVPEVKPAEAKTPEVKPTIIQPENIKIPETPQPSRQVETEPLPSQDEILTEFADVQKSDELQQMAEAAIKAGREYKTPPPKPPETTRAAPLQPAGPKIEPEPIPEKPKLVIRDSSHLGHPVPKPISKPKPPVKRLSPHKEVLELGKERPQPQETGPIEKIPVKEIKDQPLEPFVKTKKGKEFDETVKKLDTLGASGILLDILDDEALEEQHHHKMESFQAAADVIDDIRVMGPEPEKPEPEEPQEKPTLIEQIPAVKEKKEDFKQLSETSPKSEKKEEREEPVKKEDKPEPEFTLPHNHPMPQPLQPEEIEAMLARQNNAKLEVKDKEEEEPKRQFPPSPATPFPTVSPMPVVDPDKRKSNALSGYFKDIFQGK